MNQERTKSILEMARGAFIERADLEMAKIIANILDPNTETKPARKLTITLSFKTDDDRTNVAAECTVKSTLAPLKPSQTFLYISDDDNVVEMTPQIPGQQFLDGGEQAAPAMLKLIKFA